MWHRIAEVADFKKANAIANEYRKQGYGEPPDAPKQVQVKRAGLDKDIYVVRIRDLTEEKKVA